MYLKNLFIENMGSIERLQILEKDLFLDNGNPRPIILLGKNGSGKTTLISSIADSFLELGNQVFNHILPNEGIGHKYYKASGQINTRLGEEYSYTYLQYKSGEKFYEYIDKNGKLGYDECKEKTNNLLNLESGDRGNDDNYKYVSDISNDDFFKDFQNNTYCYFPADRFEFPHWLIRDTDKHVSKIIDEQKYYGDLRKQIIVKNSLDGIKSWLLDLFLDSKFSIKDNGNGGYLIEDNKSPLLLKKLNQWIINVEKMLTLILDKNVKLTVNLRGRGSRLNIFDIDNGRNLLPSLDNLSTGESILLCMFGTIIKNSDSIDLSKDIELHNIKGIVVIDEIDLHLHIRLQKEVLPKLIKLFPKVQFIISTHSPFFLYGMNKEFGDDTLMLNMPSGVILDNYDNFEEFQQAFNTFESLTENYKLKYEELSNSLNIENDIIICEGRTDVIHIKKAIEKLGIENLDNIQFIEIPNDWGDSELKKALKYIAMLSHANKIIGIFDRDREDTIRDIGELKGYGNNVYAFCIPVPEFRDQFNKISIEFYYEDKDLKKMDSEGNCLYFNNEFYFDDNRKIIRKKTPDEIIEDPDKYIYDKDIGAVEGVYSKARFAELVETDDEFIESFNFENFMLIIDKIKEILQSDGNQSN